MLDLTVDQFFTAHIGTREVFTFGLDGKQSEIKTCGLTLDSRVLWCTEEFMVDSQLNGSEPQTAKTSAFIKVLTSDDQLIKYI